MSIYDKVWRVFNFWLLTKVFFFYGASGDSSFSFDIGLAVNTMKVQVAVRSAFFHFLGSPLGEVSVF